MLELKRNSLSVALATAMLLGTPLAYAQTADAPAQATQDEEEATELDGIVVTGIRRGIEDAIEAKQSSTSIVEAISAEDIGKLPDSSIADSIARLPGLTAQRFGGRPQEINVRGTPGDFTNTTLNGREQVSLGNNRSVEFDQYPSELISQVIVYKTPDASLIGQGLAATVDLRTVRPLSFGERAFAVNVRGEMNKLGDEKEYGNRFSVSYIDQFADNTVGLALGYARLNNPGQGYQFEAWGYDDGLLGGGKLYDFENENERDGFMGVLEFKPNDSYHTALDFFYSKFDKEEIKRGMEFGFGGSTLLSRTDNEDGTAVEFSGRGFNPVLRNDFNSWYDDLFSIGWNHKLKLDEAWTLNLDISNSSAKREQRVLETYAGLIPGLAENVTFDGSFNSNGYFNIDPDLDFGDTDIIRLTDAGGWGGDTAQDGYIKDFVVEDELTSVRFDLERSFDAGFVSAIKFGANLTDRTKSRSALENKLCLAPNCTKGASSPIPPDLLTTSEFDFARLGSLVGYDALRAFNDGVYFRVGNLNGDIANKNWDVRERISTGFVQANLDTDLGPIRMRGNVGVQAVNTEQESEGLVTFEGTVLSDPTVRGANYTHYLPSANLIFDLPAEQILRFAVARQMARPRMDDLRGNAGFGLNRTRDIWEGNGGNPELDPWLANAADLSYEKYFEGKAYLSAAVFYKDLRSYITDTVVPFDFNELPIPDDVLPGDLPPSPIGEYRQPINGKGGYVRGYELAASLPFDMLWAPLEGFGAIASYSFTESSVKPFGAGTPEPLPGLSKHVSNLTVYYERYGFTARASHRSRSKFFGEVEGFGGDRARKQFNGEKIVDVQLGYTFQAGPLQDVSLLFQVNNVTDEPFSASFPGQDQPREFYEYGRTYLLGASYRF